MTATEQLAARWDSVMMPNYGTPRSPSPAAGAAGSRTSTGASISTSSPASRCPRSATPTRRWSRRWPGRSARWRTPATWPCTSPGSGWPSGWSACSAATAGCSSATTALRPTRLRSLARRHGRALDPGGGRLGLVAAEGGFHGRTLGALALTGNPAKRQPFEPLPGPVTFVPYGDAAALRAAVTDRTAAVFLEPTLGEGGVVPPPAGYLRAAREACDATGALLVLDEVQSGIGRTGAWFAHQAEGIRPDVVTLAKGLGGGLPIGACVGLGAAGGLFAAGDHGSTFGGNPVSAAAALAVLDTIDGDDLLASVRTVGDRLAAGLAGIDDPLVVGVRGSGLWRALVLTAPVAAQVEAAARRAGLLVNAVQPDAVRLAPPLVLSAAEADEAVAGLRAAVAEVGGATVGAASAAGASGAGGGPAQDKGVR